MTGYVHQVCEGGEGFSVIFQSYSMEKFNKIYFMDHEKIRMWTVSDLGSFIGEMFD